MYYCNIPHKNRQYVVEFEFIIKESCNDSTMSGTSLEKSISTHFPTFENSLH